MKTVSTKKALLMSVLSVLVCFTMLLGTTFAWFTDSVTSTNNKIVAGNLKIDLELLDKATGNWNSIKDSKAPLFSEDSLWEPGYTEVKILKVENEGSLALKWKATFSSSVALSALADVLDVYVKVGQNSYPERADLAGWTKAGTVREFVEKIESTTYGTLTAKGTAGAEAYLGLAVKMREEANNDYQNMSIGAFDITILATQLASEEDSFDELYDAFADYDGEISNAVSLKAALTNGGTYKVISDFTADEVVTIPAGVTVNLDLGGNTITSDATVINNEGTLVLDGNGTVDVSGATEYAVPVVNNGTLTVNNGVYVGASAMPSYAFENYGKMTINDSTVDGGFGGVWAMANSETVINDGIFSHRDDPGAHIVYAKAGAKVTINGGDFLGHVQSNNNWQYVVYAVNGADVEINGGNFVSFTHANGTQRLMFNANAPVEITGGTYDKDPSAFVAANHNAIKNADGTWTVANVTGKTQVAEGLYVGSDADYSVYSAAGFTALNGIIASGVKSVTLMADIDMTGKTWTEVDMHQDYGGKLTLFDGNGHTISNMVINGQAMFTVYTVAGDSVFKDVTFKNVTVNSSALNTAIITIQLYTDMTLENVDVVDSTIKGNYKVSTLIGTVYNENGPVTATLKDCDVSNCVVRGNLDFMVTGFIGFVYESNNDFATFENCTISDTVLKYGSEGYNAVAYVYCNDGSAAGSFDEVDGVTVTNCSKVKE